MRTITQTFEEISDSTYTSSECSECDKTIQKTLTRSQTINPWNQKTRMEIHVENMENLQTDEKTWLAKSHKCHKCTNPEIELDVITKEDWLATKSLRDEVADLIGLLGQKTMELENLFKGRHIQIGERTALVRYYAHEYSSFQGPLVRKDGRGYLGDDKQFRSAVVFKD